MFEIRKDDAIIARTEKPNYIYLHPEGYYVLCDKEEAQGIAVDGVPYALLEGFLGECEAVVLTERDGGDIIGELYAQSDNTAKLSGQIAVAAKMSVQDSAEIEDDDALKMPDLFRTWAEVLARGVALAAQTIINKDGKLYRVQNIVTPAKHQPPDGEGMLALYRPIDIAHAGTKEDPIAWEYGMDCSAGLYYTYAGELWKCAGDMKPCVWQPGTAGVWQWERVTE